MIKNHINNLVHLAKIDDNIEEKELALIFSIGEKHGLTRPEIQEIIDNPKGLRIHVNDSKDDNNRFDQIYNIVELMMADKKLLESELQFCIKMAKKLGFREEKVGNLIRTIVEGLLSHSDKELIKINAIRQLS
jgi:uncharacterized tellurite resistance protein B-like protein